MAISSTSSAAASSGIEDFSRFSTRRLGSARDRVRDVAWNLDGRRLATGGQDRTLRIYLPDKGVRDATECRGHAGEVSCVRWSPAHPERLASCSASSQDKALHFWDIRQGSKPTSSIDTFGDNISMSWSPDGKTIVLGNRNDKVIWVDVEQQRIVKSESLQYETNETTFSHNGSLLFYTADGSVQINAHPSNAPIYKVNISTASTTVLDLDPRGRYLVAGSNDTLMTLWETEEWTCAGSSGEHEDPIRVCKFSAEGNYIASSALDSNGIVISDVPSLKKLHSITGAAACDSLAWHPTRNILAYGGGDAGIWGAGV
ncbi:hypothetical protein JCM8547_004720 [Rhodosporidiobolus lusitaniae]